MKDVFPMTQRCNPREFQLKVSILNRVTGPKCGYLSELRRGWQQ